MADLTLKDLADEMAKIDFAMLITRTTADQLAARPMSNNGEVEYDGKSYYFTWEHSRMIEDIEAAPQVGLSFQGSRGLLGQPPMFISVEGRADLVRDKGQFKKHWDKELDRWFTDGPETPGIVMIRVTAERIHYWKGEDEGEITP